MSTELLLLWTAYYWIGAAWLIAKAMPQSPTLVAVVGPLAMWWPPALLLGSLFMPEWDRTYLQLSNLLMGSVVALFMITESAE